MSDKVIYIELSWTAKKNGEKNIKPGRSSDRSSPMARLILNFRLMMQLILGAYLSVSEARFHFQCHDLGGYWYDSKIKKI